MIGASQPVAVRARPDAANRIGVPLDPGESVLYEGRPRMRSLPGSMAVGFVVIALTGSCAALDSGALPTRIWTHGELPDYPAFWVTVCFVLGAAFAGLVTCATALSLRHVITTRRALETYRLGGIGPRRVLGDVPLAGAELALEDGNVVVARSPRQRTVLHLPAEREAVLAALQAGGAVLARGERR